MAAARIVQPLPQFEGADEFAFLVIEFGLLLIGLGLVVQRAVAHVLHAQGRGDDQRLVECAALVGFQQDTANARVERQTCQRLSGSRELVGIVHRIQFVQQLVAVGNGFGARRLQKREALHIAQMQRMHAQDDTCKRTAQNFGIGKRRTGYQVLLVIQADADAVGHTSAAARALVGCSLADGFHQQLFHLVAVAVALDACGSAVDHIADAWNGE